MLIDSRYKKKGLGTRQQNAPLVNLESLNRSLAIKRINLFDHT